MNPFAYIHGSSLLHGLDPRCKFFILCLVSITMLSAGPVPSAIFAGILIFFFKNTGLALLPFLRALRYFMIILFLVFAARALAVPGDIIFSFHGISATKQGIAQGIMVAFRFFLIMVTGAIFTATTKPGSVKAAVQWFLKPIPFIPEKRLGVMISLALGFMPVIFRQAGEISDAGKARCGDLEKNPIKKINRIAMPLLRKTFMSADNLVLAMQARCYDEDRTDPEFNPCGAEIYFIAGAVATALCFTMF
jgi:energy-coupling factor transporter transmembrane protein EcfT